MLKLWIISVIMGCIKKRTKSHETTVCVSMLRAGLANISDKETQTQTGWLTGSHCVCSLSDHCLAVQSYWRLGYLKSWTHNPSKCSSSSHFLFHCAYFSPPPISASTFLCPVFMFYPWTSVPSRQPNSSTLTLSLHPPTQSYLLVFLLKFIISSSSPKSTPLDLFLTIISCRSNCVPLCCVGVTKDVKQKWVRWSRVLFAYTPNGSTDTGQVGRRQLFL